MLDNDERWELRSQLESEIFKWCEYTQGFVIALKVCRNYKQRVLKKKRKKKQFVECSEKSVYSLTHN